MKGKNLMRIKPSFQNKINTTHYYNIFAFSTFYSSKLWLKSITLHCQKRENFGLFANWKGVVVLRSGYSYVIRSHKYSHCHIGQAIFT